MDRMGALDSAFLDIEQSGPPVAVGALMQIQGRPPTLAKLRSFVAGRLPKMERFRQKVVPAPIRVRQPKWVEVTLDLKRHVQQIRVKPGANLDPIVSRIMEMKLSHDAPLWDLHLITGYSTEEWAVVIRMHHSIADGQGASVLMGSLIDLNPDGTMTLADGIVAMTASHDDDADTDEASRAAALRAMAYQSFADLGEFITSVPATVETLRRSLTPHPPSELTGPVSARRKWVHAVYPLSDIKAARKSLKGATINDMVLTAVAVGFRELLESRGAQVENRQVRAVMPVSLRKDLRSNNQVSMLPSPLPVGETDLNKQLRAIREYTKVSKASKSPQMLDELIKVSQRLTPAGLQHFVVSRTGRLGELLAETVVTNVPGSPVPVYFAGQTLLQSSPIIPIEGTVRITIGVTSYQNNLNIGVTGDGDNSADIDVLVKGIVHGFDELVALVAG